MKIFEINFEIIDPYLMRLSNVFTEERQHLPLLLFFKFETIRQGVLCLN